MGEDTACETPMQDMSRAGNLRDTLGGMQANPMGRNVPQPLSIGKVLNGYIVTVGCKQIVFETREKMLSELDRYLKNPAQVEKEYLSKETV